MPSNVELIERLSVALALGLLIGLERGWERRDLPEGQRAAGLRTFGLIALLGGIAEALAGSSQALLLGAVALVLGGALALGYWRESEREQDVSLTTTIAALVTFGLGALAGRGELAVAASAAVVVTLILGFKPELHGFLRRIERAELLATLRLLLISVVILPILPNRGFGPWKSINPYELWWMVVLVAALSYAGYFAIKSLGAQRGVLLTGLFGGLVSSTAVAVSLSRADNKLAQTQELLAAGIVAAGATVFPRMVVIVAVLAPTLAARIAWPLLLAGAGGFLAAGWYAWRSRQGEISEGTKILKLANPLDLRTAFQFGFLLAAIMVLSRAAIQLMGNRGLYGLAALSGLVDVDAITLSVVSMSKIGQTTMAVASLAILLPAVVNTLVKAALVIAISGWRMGIRVSAGLIAALAAGAIGLWMTAPF
jgi:uncharacterized membrane protein (DUF4010 family)